jgi:hypothetical protein
MFCGECGEAYEEGSGFCGGCGVARPEETTPAELTPKEKKIKAKEEAKAKKAEANLRKEEAKAAKKEEARIKKAEAKYKKEAASKGVVATSNISKYHVGQRVDGLGGGTISGWIAEITPKKQYATSGPGVLKILDSRSWEDPVPVTSNQDTSPDSGPQLLYAKGAQESEQQNLEQTTHQPKSGEQKRVGSKRGNPLAEPLISKPSSVCVDQASAAAARTPYTYVQPEQGMSKLKKPLIDNDELTDQPIAIAIGDNSSRYPTQPLRVGRGVVKQDGEAGYLALGADEDVVSILAYKEVSCWLDPFGCTNESSKVGLSLGLSLFVIVVVAPIIEGSAFTTDTLQTGAILFAVSYILAWLFLRKVVRETLYLTNRRIIRESAIVKVCIPQVIYPAGTTSQKSYFLDNLYYMEHMYRAGPKKCCGTAQPFTQLYLSFRRAPEKSQTTRTGASALDWSYILPWSYSSVDNLTIEKHGTSDAMDNFDQFHRDLMEHVPTKHSISKQTNISDTCDETDFDVVGYGSSENKVNAIKNLVYAPISKVAVILGTILFLLGILGEADWFDMPEGLPGALLGVGALIVLLAFLASYCDKTLTYYILTDRRLIQLKKKRVLVTDMWITKKSWLIKDLAFAKYKRENAFWVDAFACFPDCIRGTKVKHQFDLNFRGVGGATTRLQVSPDQRHTSMHVQSFFADLLQFPGIMDENHHWPRNMDPPNSGTNLNNLMLLDGEQVVQSVNVLDKGSSLIFGLYGTPGKVIEGILLLVLAIVCFVEIKEVPVVGGIIIGADLLLTWYHCLYPRWERGELILTNFKLIFSGRQMVPLTQLDIGVAVAYYPLSNLNQVQFGNTPAGCIPAIGPIACCPESTSLAIDFNDGVNTYTSIAYNVEPKDCAQAKVMAKCLAVTHPSIEE